MAKWGEGDPRWIVEERPDAVNVNNWHWTEKNASNWSRDKLKQLLLDLVIDEPSLGKCKITELTSIDGEAIANNRKAKLIFFYEWNIKAEWKGYLNGQDESLAIKGTLEIPNLSEENDADEIDVEISLKSENTNDSEKLKQLMRNKGTKIIRQQLAKYIEQLKSDFAKDLILPTKDTVTNSSDINVKNKTEIIKSTTVLNKTNTINGCIDKQVSNVKHNIECKDLEFSEKLKCRADECFRVFTVKELVTAFTQGPVEIEPKVNGKFSLFDGNVTGWFTHLEEPKLIVQKWRFKAWPIEYYSNVEISIEEKNDHTILKVKQTGIPKNDYERTEHGWRLFYFEAIKKTFGFGAMLY